LLSGKPIFVLNKETMSVMEKGSQQVWASTMTSASMVESAVSVCNLIYYHKTGQLATVMTRPNHYCSWHMMHHLSSHIHSFQKNLIQDNTQSSVLLMDWAQDHNHECLEILSYLFQYQFMISLWESPPRCSWLSVYHHEQRQP
jgi:hypothetical protein